VIEELVGGHAGKREAGHVISKERHTSMIAARGRDATILY